MKIDYHAIECQSPCYKRLRSVVESLLELEFWVGPLINEAVHCSSIVCFNSEIHLLQVRPARSAVGSACQGSCTLFQHHMLEVNSDDPFITGASSQVSCRQCVPGTFSTATGASRTVILCDDVLMPVRFGKR